MIRKRLKGIRRINQPPHNIDVNILNNPNKLRNALENLDEDDTADLIDELVEKGAGSLDNLRERIKAARRYKKINRSPG